MRKDVSYERRLDIESPDGAGPQPGQRVRGRTVLLRKERRDARKGTLVMATRSRRVPGTTVLVTCVVLATGGLGRVAHADESAGPPHLDPSQHFTIDPVVDGVIIVGGAGFAELLSLILSTGEIRPTPPGDPNDLLSIDRIAITQTIDPHAGTYSDVGLYAAYGYALLDPILSGVRDGRRAFLVDALLYGESIAITKAFTDATKIGVRRPRPIDYINCPSGIPAPTARTPTSSFRSFRGMRPPPGPSPRRRPTSRSCEADGIRRAPGSRWRQAPC